MRPHRDPLAAEGARARPQHQVEGILGIDGQAADLGALHDRGPRDVARLLVVAEQRQGDDVRGGMLDGVPLEDDRRLRCIPAAEDRRRGLGLAKGMVDGILEREEGGLRLLLGREVARDGDVDDAAG